jgi:hypothetical protein
LPEDEPERNIGGDKMKIQTRAIDQLLRTAVEANQVPGVVTLATTDRETIYNGAFGKRAFANNVPMTSYIRYRFLDCIDDETGDRGSRHATG